MTTEGPVFIHHRIPAAHNSSSIVKKTVNSGTLVKRRNTGRFWSHWFSYPIQTSAPAVELSYFFVAENMANTLNIFNQI